MYEQDYFEWLCEMVHANCDRNGKTWWILMNDLYRRQFIAIVQHDENRAGDGLDLREEYMRELPSTKYVEIDKGCTVLEMLIGLARRIDFELSDPFDISVEDRTAYWFWEMLENLKLTDYDDDSYAGNGGIINVPDILDKFLMREYKRSGVGGLFPLRKSHKDQRQVEIWYQMSAYLAEKKAV